MISLSFGLFRVWTKKHENHLKVAQIGTSREFQEKVNQVLAILSRLAFNFDWEISIEMLERYCSA